MSYQPSLPTILLP